MTTLIIGLLIPLLWPVSSSTVISSILFLQKLAGREAVVANENPKPISPLQFTIIGIAVVQLERLEVFAKYLLSARKITGAIFHLKQQRKKPVK